MCFGPASRTRCCARRHPAPHPAPPAAPTTPHPLCSRCGFFSSDHVHALRLLVWDGGGHGGCPRGSGPPTWAAGGLRSWALPPTHPVLVDFCQSPAQLRCPRRGFYTPPRHPAQRGDPGPAPGILPQFWPRPDIEREAQAQASGGSAAASGPSKSRALGRALAPLPVSSGNAGRSASPHGLHPRP